jgi:hypothetical protein
LNKTEYGVKAERDVYVTVRDGVLIAVNIYRPDAEGRFPALLAMGGYGKELQECLIPPQPMEKSALWDGNIEAGDTPEIVKRGYVHVIGDVRGTGKSKGEWCGIGSTQEGKDGYDVIEWIAQQPWCNGNVGMIGYSYYSQTQMATAVQQPPHLRAIFVSHVWADYYGEVYNEGVINLFFYGHWDGRQGTSGYAPKNMVSKMVKTLPKEEFERRRQELLNHPDIVHYPNLYHLLNYPQKNPYFFDMLMNPLDGPFWWERSVYRDLDKINVPVFVVGKVAHEGMGFWEVYAGVSTPKRLLVKPHGPEERPWREDLELIMKWYDHWLKGEKNDVMDGPPIRMFVQGINQWRNESEWPLPGVEWTKCYLRRWGGLSFAPELYQVEPDCFLQQPLFLSNKRDSVQYVSPPMSENLEVIGPASINFFASIDQDDTSWIVTLCDVSPTGIETRLGRAYMKASHRILDPAKSKDYAPCHRHDKVEPVVPGTITEYNLSLDVITNVFLPAHRMRLLIESMESSRDPEMVMHYHPRLCSGRTTLHKIYRNTEYQSHMLLPVHAATQTLKDYLSDDNVLGL